MGADNGERDHLIEKVSEKKKIEKVLWSSAGRNSPEWGRWRARNFSRFLDSLERVLLVSLWIFHKDSIKILRSNQNWAMNFYKLRLYCIAYTCINAELQHILILFKYEITLFAADRNLKLKHINHWKKHIAFIGKYHTKLNEMNQWIFYKFILFYFILLFFL